MFLSFLYFVFLFFESYILSKKVHDCFEIWASVLLSSTSRTRTSLFSTCALKDAPTRTLVLSPLTSSDHMWMAFVKLFRLAIPFFSSSAVDRHSRLRRNLEAQQDLLEAPRREGEVGRRRGVMCIGAASRDILPLNRMPLGAKLQSSC